MYVSFYWSIYLFIYLSFFLCLSICLSASLKTKLFCETSSFFEVDNIKNEAILWDFFMLNCIRNEAILRDFLNFWTWQHQKQSNSARLPSKMESWVQSWQPSTNAFCDFSSPPVESIAPAMKKWCQVIRSAAPVTQNHLSKPEDLMLQNATLLRKSAPSPPNSSDEDVSCTAPATENASLQILFKCPTPAIVFGNATKPSRFAHFWQGAQSLAPATRTEIWTSKSGPYMVCFVDFDFEMCFAPQQRALFRHLNFQKWSEHGVFCTFWLRNVLRATTACNFSSLIWPDGSAPAALASLLFDLPEPQIIGKTVFRGFPTFSRICIFFLLTLSLLWSLFCSSLLSDSSHLCFSSVHIVGSLTSKLPSNSRYYSLLRIYIYIYMMHTMHSTYYCWQELCINLNSLHHKHTYIHIM